ncbi:adenylyl-sulfate kinase [bacterium]|nr:adenylyl-sulfate kinase [bacterium]
MSITLARQNNLTTYQASFASSLPMLRLMTCGSVDDGKSTLIGQMLLMTGSIHDDQVEVLRRETEKHGTAGVPLDPALLLDGLEDERKQGITIDVAYRYFQTRRRKFIIADSPGHEQYTRNMATAASVSDVAIILVDARKGILPQTCRHSYIVSLMGIRHVILAINKMDLVDYQESVFESVMEKYRGFSKTLGFQSLHGIPISGLHADNMVSKSPKTPWFKGKPLLEVLENIDLNQSKALGNLRFPVQRVCRPNLDFRGYSGTVVSGEIAVGDRVKVVPGGGETKIKSIVTMDGSIPIATAGSPVTLTLENELDLSRGDMIADAKHPPALTNDFQAMLVWMSSTPLNPRGQYLLRTASKWSRAEIKLLHHRVNVETLAEHPASTLGMNEIGLCSVQTRDPLAVDNYVENRSTGSFILVDCITNETMAAGMIRISKPASASSTPTNSKIPENSLSQMDANIASILTSGVKGTTILCALTFGSMLRDTLNALEDYCKKTNTNLLKLDTVTIRRGVCSDLGFSDNDNTELLRRMIEITRLVKNSVDICLVSWDMNHQWPINAPVDLITTNVNIIIHDEHDEKTNVPAKNQNLSGSKPRTFQEMIQDPIINVTSVEFSKLLASILEKRPAG